MNSEINKKYIEFYKNTKEIEFVEHLIERIKFAFRDNLLNNNWLSDKTRERAILKLDSINIVVGFKKPGRNFIPFSTDSVEL